LRYNNGNVLADVPSNQYVAYWIFATNEPATPIASLMGQRVDVLIASARENNKYESLTLGTLPFQEMKLLYRIIYRNDATPYEEAQDLRSVSNLPAGTYVATNHNVLTGLTTGDDHTQYVLNEGDTGNINITGRVNATSLQGEGDSISNLSGGNLTGNLTFGNSLYSENGAYWQRILMGDNATLTDATYSFQERQGSGSYVDLMSIQGDGNATMKGAAIVNSTSGIYFGPQDVNGSWRMRISVTNFTIDRRENGTWVRKGAFTP
jgi:hypothetical protein